MQFFDHLRIDATDAIAAIFIVFYIICKLNHVDTAVDAAVAMIIAFYFGSKHKSSNNR